MNLATLYMDTHKIVTLLQNKGYSKEQADGFLEAIREITVLGVATKEDVEKMKQDLIKAIAIIDDRSKSQFQWIIGMMLAVLGLLLTLSVSIFTL